VSSFPRSAQNKEKEVDCAITADVVENVAHSNIRDMKYKNGYNIIVLLTGDRDMVPAVKKVIAQNGIWRVEVVGLEHSMSGDLKVLEDDHKPIVTNTILDVDKFTYLEPNWVCSDNSQVIYHLFQLNCCKLIKELSRFASCFPRAKIQNSTEVKIHFLYKSAKNC
jgi:hypothetical protein